MRAAPRTSLEPLPTLPDGQLADWVRNRQVARVMTRAVATVTRDTLVGVAEWVAARRGVRHLPVMEGGLLVGLASEWDMRRVDSGATIGGCMTREPTAIHPSRTIGEAATVMQEQAVSCLPVTASGLLLGILTRGDLRRAGVPASDLEEPECVSCGTVEHVRVDPRGTSVLFCLDCLDRAHEEVEVGDVD